MALGARKAKKILRHRVIRGKLISKAQKGLFGLIAGGGVPSKVKNIMKRRAR